MTSRIKRENDICQDDTSNTEKYQEKVEKKPLFFDK